MHGTAVDDKKIRLMLHMQCPGWFCATVNCWQKKQKRIHCRPALQPHRIEATILRYSLKFGWHPTVLYRNGYFKNAKRLSERKMQMRGFLLFCTAVATVALPIPIHSRYELIVRNPFQINLSVNIFTVFWWAASCLSTRISSMDDHHLNKLIHQ